MKAISIISFALLRISQKQKLPLLLILGFSYCAWALSPALAYNIDTNISELVNKSNFIALATYQGYDKDKGDAYPPCANFKLVQILAGKPCCKTKLPIRFVRSQNIDENPPDGWHASPERMPELGSRWIIFLERFQPHDGAFDTYKGSLGRVAYTHETLLFVREKIKLRFGDKALISYARNFAHKH
ncbi:hypothetical protein KA183_08160 [bacterium]|nr:hypothetical protein [bacterium]